MTTKLTKKEDAMTTKLTKAESKYISQMFCEDLPELKGIKDIRKMPLGCAGMFLENREQGVSEKEWPSDFSISKKYLAAHGLPATMTYAEWSKWLNKQPKHLR